MIELPPLSWILFHSVAHDLPCWRLRSKKKAALCSCGQWQLWVGSLPREPGPSYERSLPDRHMQWVCTDYAGAHATGSTGVLDIEGLQVCLADRLSIAILTYSCLQAPQLRHVTLSAPSIALQQFDILMLASATVATCYAFCTINRFTTVWHTHACKRHSCDMIGLLHQQSLYNSLTYSCLQAPQLRHDRPSAPSIALQQFDILQAPQLRHVTLSAPTIALQQFDILMLASAAVATW